MHFKSEIRIRAVWVDYLCFREEGVVLLLQRLIISQKGTWWHLIIDHRVITRCRSLWRRGGNRGIPLDADENLHFSDQITLVLLSLFKQPNDFVKFDHELGSLLLQVVYLIVYLLVLQNHPRRFIFYVLLQEFDSRAISNYIIHLIVQIILLRLMRNLRQLNLLLFILDLIFNIGDALFVPLQLLLDYVVLSMSPRFPHIVKRVELLIVKFDFAIFADSRGFCLFATFSVVGLRSIEDRRILQ